MASVHLHKYIQSNNNNKLFTVKVLNVNMSCMLQIMPILHILEA